MSSGFQTELRNALDEPMKEMRETADAMRKAANLDFEPTRVDGDTGQPAVDTPAAAETADPVATPEMAEPVDAAEPADAEPVPPATVADDDTGGVTPA